MSGIEPTRARLAIWNSEGDLLDEWMDGLSMISISEWHTSFTHLSFFCKEMRCVNFSTLSEYVFIFGKVELAGCSGFSQATVHTFLYPLSICIWPLFIVFSLGSVNSPCIILDNWKILSNCTPKQISTLFNLPMRLLLESIKPTTVVPITTLAPSVNQKKKKIRSLPLY